MYEVFFHNFNQKVPLTEKEEQDMKMYLVPKKVRKKQYLLQEGDVCKYTTFVEKGLLKSYTIGDKGQEYIIQFASEGWIISDLYSFLTQEPATYTIDAIEDSEIILITHAAHEEMLKKFPKYETYTRLNMTGAYIAMQKRLTSVFTANVEERYESFKALYPEIIQRVPQHMIASYMGLTPETLSRVRQKINRK